MTRSYFLHCLAAILTDPVLDALQTANISLPRIATMAATQCFLMADCDSRAAKAVREQLQYLETHGSFVFAS